jgi:hypothetical protein
MEKDLLIQAGLKALDDALLHFTQVEGCSKSSSITLVLHGLLVLAQSVYGVDKK